MRVVTFLLSLALSLACIVLNFLGFNGTLSLTQYMLISIAVEVILAFLLGYFMHRTYANRKAKKKNTSSLEEANAKIDDLQHQLAAAQACANQAEKAAAAQPAQAPAPDQATTEVPKTQAPAADPGTTTLFKAPLVTPEETAAKEE